MFVPQGLAGIWGAKGEASDDWVGVTRFVDSRRCTQFELPPRQPVKVSGLFDLTLPFVSGFRPLLLL